MTLDTYIVHLNSGPDCAGTRRPDGTCLPPRGAITVSVDGSAEAAPRPDREALANEPESVLILGDLNIGGPPSGRGNPGYEDIVAILKSPDDLWTSARPREDGYTFDCLVNNTASDCDYQNRIDYIFVATDRTLTNSPHLVRVAKEVSREFPGLRSRFEVLRATRSRGGALRRPRPVARVKVLERRRK